MVAAVVGFCSIGLGAYGYRSLDFTQWFLGAARVFDNPAYGNITADEWRAGMTLSIFLFVAFGVLSLLAAFGLFYQKRWARILWLCLIVLLILEAVPALPEDRDAWVWLLVSCALFGLSWFALRDPRVPPDGSA